ncbi:hypothetical protein PRUPE_8G073500 [Prunus persica]|uniref:GTD-binding domain-containing protein n=1 Tax=Prunus persica TaxID=3760 RepID=A0A251MUL3_PRUPE|nr:protein FLOURY 1-like [Prunus persica]ONH90775.1 hypothetical protein PRUPE_8G073500 [Prunus persica]
MECASCIKLLSQGSDFGCGFFMFGRFSLVFKLLGLFLVFVLGLKVLQVGCHAKCLIEFLCDFRGKASEVRNGFCSKRGFDEVYAPKSLENSQPLNADGFAFSKKIKAKAAAEDEADDVDDDAAAADDDDDGDKEESICCNEDGEFDALALRKSVKIERRKTNKARVELEKERMAAASAAEETMAMILRLQNEKSCIEIQANQYRRMAEQKQQFDEEVIQSLQWIIMRHESERSLLQEQLTLCKQKLQQYAEVDERRQPEDGNPSANDGMDDMFDVDSWERPQNHIVDSNL